MITSTHIVAWLGTYAIHSTLLLGIALVATRIFGSSAAKEIFWRAAILGALFTTTLHSVVATRPLAERWTVSVGGDSSPLPVAPATPEGISNDRASSNNAEIGRSTWSNLADYRMPALLFIWAIGSLILVIRLMTHHRRLTHALRDRRQLNDGPLPSMLAELRRRAGLWSPVRLSESAACPTPIAIGRNEICVPARFESLAHDEQRSALAHELAHLKRRDPLWQLGAGIIESIFFFQPLNVVGRRELRSAAEYLCDDWAVEQTGSPMALAKCLTQISSWVGTARVPDGMLAMAEGGSPLVTRIDRLLNWRGTTSRGTQLALASALVMIALVATSAPAFSANETSITPPQVVAQSTTPDSVIIYRGGADFNTRWSWARSNAPGGAHWIGWEIDAIDPRGQPIASSTAGLPRADASAPPLSSLVRATRSAGRAAILVRFDDSGRITGTVFQLLDERVWLGGRTLLWLGHADAEASFNKVQELFQKSDIRKHRADLAAAQTIHADRARVISTIRELISRERDPDIRTEAIQWLARLHGADPRTTELFTRLTLNDADADVREEAVDALRTSMRKGNPTARDALRRVADSNADMNVRSEAMQALSRSK